MTKDIVYKATVTTSNTNSTKHYRGMTASTFKERYRNHIKSFNHKRYSNDTELSKYIWKLKDNKQNFDITWTDFHSGKLVTLAGDLLRQVTSKISYCGSVLRNLDNMKISACGRT